MRPQKPSLTKTSKNATIFLSRWQTYRASPLGGVTTYLLDGGKAW